MNDELSMSFCASFIVYHSSFIVFLLSPAFVLWASSLRRTLCQEAVRPNKLHVLSEMMEGESATRLTHW